MKKKVIALIAVVVIAAAGGGSFWYYNNQNKNSEMSENAVFVDSVADIAGLTDASGRYSRFSGIVEPQRTEKIELASGLKVKKTYVSVGDEVEVGTKLFSYDTDEAQDSITQLEIDIENYEISIESSEAQVKQLEKERDKASNDEKLSYTTQIMTTQNSIKRNQYEMKSKKAEMESLKRQIANADVTSPLQGIVKTINKSSDDSSDISDSVSSDDNSSAFMTIMATGEYRIKGKINEQNMSEIQEGTDMIIYSRVNEEETWKGIIATIDKESASSNQANSFYDSGDSSMSSSSSYPFYIDLESSEGLMLGQHVYAVVDSGQLEHKDGIWIDDYYFITDEDGAVTNYVWAADENDKLVKREVTFGNFDDENFKYEILGGLTEDDFIAFPSEECKEGMTVTRNIDQVSDWSDDSMMENYSIDGDYTDGDYIDGDYIDGGMGIEEGYYEPDDGEIFDAGDAEEMDGGFEEDQNLEEQ